MVYPIRLFARGLFAATEIVGGILLAVAFFIWPMLVFGGVADAMTSGDTGTYVGAAAELCWLLIIYGYDLE